MLNAYDKEINKMQVLHAGNQQVKWTPRDPHQDTLQSNFLLPKAKDKDKNFENSNK